MLLVAALTWLIAWDHPGEAARRGHNDNPPLRPHPEVEGAYLFTAPDAAHEWTEPLERPDWVRASGAGFMRESDPVIGLVQDGQAYAIPWWVLKNHHVANLALGSDGVVIAFCEMCSSAVGFRGRQEGRPLSFELVGLYNGSILIADRETGTLWAPFSGVALHGPLAPAQLPRRIIHQGTWSEWRARHPGTLVVEADPSERGGHGERSAPGQSGIGGRFRQSLLRDVDPRLPPHTLVAGIAVGEARLAVPLQAFEDGGPILDDTLGGRHVRLQARPGSRLVSAFVSPGGTSGKGGRADSSLAPLPVNVEEWYIWTAYNPDTRIFRN